MAEFASRRPDDVGKAQIRDFDQRVRGLAHKPTEGITGLSSQYISQGVTIFVDSKDAPATRWSTVRIYEKVTPDEEPVILQEEKYLGLLYKDQEHGFMLYDKTLQEFDEEGELRRVDAFDREAFGEEFDLGLHTVTVDQYYDLTVLLDGIHPEDEV